MASATLHSLVSICLCKLTERSLEHSGHFVCGYASPNSIGSVPDRACVYLGRGREPWKKGGIQSYPPTSINMPESPWKEGGKKEGKRGGRQAFDLETKKPNLGGRLTGKEEAKWQSKSWEPCPSIPTNDRGTPKEALHAWCPQSCAGHNPHNS